MEEWNDSTESIVEGNQNSLEMEQRQPDHPMETLAISTTRLTACLRYLSHCVPVVGNVQPLRRFPRRSCSWHDFSSMYMSYVQQELPPANRCAKTHVRRLSTLSCRTSPDKWEIGEEHFAKSLSGGRRRRTSDSTLDDSPIGYYGNIELQGCRRNYKPSASRTRKLILNTRMSSISSSLHCQGESGRFRKDDDSGPSRRDDDYRQDEDYCRDEEYRRDGDFRRDDVATTSRFQTRFQAGCCNDDSRHKLDGYDQRANVDTFEARQNDTPHWSMQEAEREMTRTRHSGKKERYSRCASQIDLSGYKSRTDYSFENHFASLCLQLRWSEVQNAIRRGQSVLGFGGSGSVYRGELKCGLPVALKVMHEKVPNDVVAQFENELMMLSKFRHPHIISLMGCSMERDRQALIFEYMPSGDLSSILHGGGPTAESSHPHAGGKMIREPEAIRRDEWLKRWENRLDVAIDVAKAVTFLHSQTPMVFHRDIKAANVLLDRFGQAKLADFGLTTQATRDDPKRVRVKRAEGTPGYADPLYTHNLTVTYETEVFSFGMLLLELLAGQPPASYQKIADHKQQLTYFLDHIDVRDPHSVLPYLDNRCHNWQPILALELISIAFE